MKNKLPALLLFTAAVVTPWLSTTAHACTIGEEMATHVPFGVTDISNADRLVIANMYIEAKKWPDVQIRAEVIAGAYKGERGVERLKQVRGENVRAYLLALGIKSENILIDKKTFTDAMTGRAPDGSLTVEQIVVGLTPLCEGSCARLCNDPRVTPKSKLIQ
jgi:hypothetical protein